MEEENSDIEDIKAKTETLTQASMKLGEAMYKASQEAAADGSDGSDEDTSETNGKSDDSTVVDADFEEVDPEAVEEKNSDKNDADASKKDD